MQKLQKHVAARTRELTKMKQAGIKMVGYMPDGYIPEELIYASGAIPVALLRGGEPDVGLEAQRYAPDSLLSFIETSLYTGWMKRSPYINCLIYSFTPLVTGTRVGYLSCGNTILVTTFSGLASPKIRQVNPRLSTILRAYSCSKAG